MDVVIRDLAGPEDAAAFRALNEEWIARHFALEDQDRRQLADPEAAYLVPGGRILLAGHGGVVVGCVALLADGTGAWELSKMAVAPGMRGQGIGRRVLQAAVAAARERGATSLFLGSSHKLPDAVHLYESLGFVHVDPSELHMPYVRASVFMRLELAPLEPSPPAP